MPKDVAHLSCRSSGGRVRFSTDAERIMIRVRLKSLEVAQCMALLASAGVDVYSSIGRRSRFLGIAAPNSYDELTYEGEVHKAPGMETITINLPRNEEITSLEVGVPEGFKVCAAAPYKREGLIYFYGSSITEGGAASRPGNAYTSLVSRRLDTDYCNLGFAASAKGERAVAELIAKREMRLLVLDYDHNAPDPDALRATYEPFFSVIRSAKPTLPILMMSRPRSIRSDEDAAVRRSIIKAAYERARASGDERVWFLDGFDFFTGDDPAGYTVDGLHPNDAGFFKMADAITPVLERILKDTSY